MLNKKMTKVFVIIGIVFVIAISVHLIGANIIEMVKNHMSMLR